MAETGKFQIEHDVVDKILSKLPKEEKKGQKYLVSTTSMEKKEAYGTDLIKNLGGEDIKKGRVLFKQKLDAFKKEGAIKARVAAAASVQGEQDWGNLPGARLENFQDFNDNPMGSSDDGLGEIPPLNQEEIQSLFSDNTAWEDPRGRGGRGERKSRKKKRTRRRKRKTKRKRKKKRRKRKRTKKKRRRR